LIVRVGVCFHVVSDALSGTSAFVITSLLGL
jgi:hypothetical protein